MLHVDRESGVEEICTVAGWIQVAPGTLHVDVVHVDLAPQRVVMLDDVNGRHYAIPRAAVCGYRVCGALSQYINPRQVTHSYTGVDFAEASASPRYPASNLQRG